MALMTSVGPHLSARNRDDDAMLMLACHVDQSQCDTCQPRINSALFHFQWWFKLQKFITNSYDLRKIRNQDQNSSKIELYVMNPCLSAFGSFEFSRKPWFLVFKPYPKNPFQNLSIFWGWAQKQKCRAWQVIQSLFLEFFKLFRKIWSNSKRRNSLNIPYLNLKDHFKI